MKISVIGTGYVGLVSGSCLSDFGLSVICVDIDKAKIELLKNGEIPIYEPGLKDFIERNTRYKRLEFTTDIQFAVENSQVIMIAVGTPSKEDGTADLGAVFEVAKNIGQYLNEYKVVVVKSTVPLGTNRQIQSIIEAELQKRKMTVSFDMVSNPEFLRQGSAVHDFTHPDRVVIGAENQKAIDIMKEVYRVLFLNETPFIITNIETAEMIKYAANAFLATKITFINEIANLCENTGANVQHVAKAIGMDGRIGSKFLHPGPGFGGSCFPKDTLALNTIAKQYNSPLTIIEAVIQANLKQKLRMVTKIENALGNLTGKTIGMLGLTFKPNTNDMRDAPSLTIISELTKRGALVKTFDPEGMTDARKYLGNNQAVIYCDNEYEVAKGSNAIVIITEWHQFRKLNLEQIKSLLAEPYFFDLRNIYNRAEVEREGMTYFGVGV
jgi:UDPglucose 6-dehydrogenase